MRNPDRESVIRAAESSWGYELGDNVMLDYDDDDGISEADGGVWVKAWLWIPAEDYDEEDKED